MSAHEAAKALEAYAAAEERVRQAKDLLEGAGAFSHLIIECERLQLRIHYEVRRAKKRLEEEAAKEPTTLVGLLQREEKKTS